MKPGLGQFQDRFAHAIFAQGSDDVDAMTELVRQPGFAVYRNTIFKGCIDALQANYPSVTRLVGAEWLRAAAAIYARLHPPQDTRMLYYGEHFPDFLADFEPAAELPYLPDVARLDRFWTESHAAPDEMPLDPAAIARLAPDLLAHTALHPHASARWAWYPAGPIYSIWKTNREAIEDGGELEWRAEGALLVRPHGAVEWIALDAAGCAFLDACMKGWPLAEAASAALSTQADADIAQLLARLLNAGAFGRLTLINE